MTDQTVTLDTKDRGQVTIPEPAWCTGHPEPQSGPDGLDVRPLACEVSHQGPSINVTVGTEHGPRLLLELLLWQDPFPKPTYRKGAEVYVVAHLLDGDHYDYDVTDLENLATDLMEAAAKVRRVAHRLAAEQSGGGR